MPSPRTRLIPLLAALLLAWFFGQAISVADRVGITADEPIHLVGGYTYWKHNDYRLQPENGNFPQRWAALPLLCMPVRDLDTKNEAWLKTDLWGAAYRFFYAGGNQPYLMILAGRCMIALLGVGAGWLVFLAARSLFGNAAGLLATAVFATTPTLLAHGALATSDMAAGFAFLLALLTGWRLLHRLTIGRTLAFGASLGVLALAKFSAGLLVVAWIPVVAVRLLRRAPVRWRLGNRRGRLSSNSARLAGLAISHCLAASLAVLVIWSAFGFRYRATAGTAPTPFNVSWEIVLGEMPYTMQTPVPQGVVSKFGVPVRPDPIRTVIRWARDRHLLPEAYLYGFAHVYTFSHWRPAFFLGEYRTTGWRTYFPVLYLLKTPLPLLGLILLGAAGISRMIAKAGRSRADARMAYRLAPYLVFSALYVGVALASPLDLGNRHLLPVEVIGCVFIGVLAWNWTSLPRWRRTLVVLLVLMNGADVWIFARPDYIAYFNALGGGSGQAYRLVVDSSLDWGQGLPALETWLHRNPAAGPVYLAYFGWDSPHYRGMRVQRLGDIYFDRDDRRVQPTLTPGTYVVSATLLHGVYTMAPEPWTAEDERRYQELLVELASADRARLPGSFWYEWDQVRFGRLANFLRHRAPDAQPDPSLLVYRLTEADLRHALLGAP